MTNGTGSSILKRDLDRLTDRVNTVEREIARLSHQTEVQDRQIQDSGERIRHLGEQTPQISKRAEWIYEEVNDLKGRLEQHRQKLEALEYNAQRNNTVVSGIRWLAGTLLVTFFSVLGSLAIFWITGSTGAN